MQQRRSAWISKGLEVLLRDRQSWANDDFDFDVVIVGSGYGGAVAADRLSRRCTAGWPSDRPNICVLERGREYLPGSFPERMAEMGGHVRFTTPAGVGAKGKREGLFDLRVGADMSVLVGNGVGGGSLINAGVLEFPKLDVFAEASWPTTLRSMEERKRLARRATRMRATLGAASATGGGNVIGDATFAKAPARWEALQGLARSDKRRAATFVPVALSIALNGNQATSSGIVLDKCVACGNCFTGCNHNAKNSLDVNLLHRAHKRGVAIYNGATVTRLEKLEKGGWALETWHTDAKLRERMVGPVQIRARRVVLAAGALGSTEILLRSRSARLAFSPRLGSRFSGNGDVLAAVFDAHVPINGVARDDEAPSAREVGPTITGMVDLRGGSAVEPGFVIQDLGVPTALRRIFEEATATSSLLHRIGESDCSDHSKSDTIVDPWAVDPAKVTNSMAVAIIGRDTALGVVTAIDEPEIDFPIDAGVKIDWPDARNDDRIDGYQARFSQLVEQWSPKTKASSGAQVLPNPMWRLLPPSMEQMLGAQRGPLLTVHPLGGCPMGNDRTHGVIDDKGQVFDGAPTDADDAVHEGLVVLDGSIVPTSLGINPALTIATLANRGIQRLLVGPWKDLVRCRSDVKGTERVERPVFRRVNPHDVPAPAQHTMVQIVERLEGAVDVGARRCWVELSLVYQPSSLHPPSGAPTMTGHVLQVAADAELSRVRVFKACLIETTRASSSANLKDEAALFVAPIKCGSLRFFHREPSKVGTRRWRAWSAWVVNRGARDTVQAIGGWLTGSYGRLSAGQRLMQSLRLATRAGEVRLFDYELELGKPSTEKPGFSALRESLKIEGHKRLTYSHRSSPWSQLMTMELQKFGGALLGAARALKVNPRYFANQGVPLLRIVDQQDQPSALVDVGAFALYVVRVLANVHLWSFRKPDAPSSRVPQRLPGLVPGLPPPVVTELALGDGKPGCIRLTNYPNANPNAQAVLMIHGYTASGTTFAHETVDPNLASYLWKSGFNPWIVDLRSSCGMPTARVAWTFEDIARADIPAAVRFVFKANGERPIDVISHCMGSAMFAMSVLDPDRANNDPAGVERRVRRWVMSQIGPDMKLTAANVLRSYLLNYVRHLLPGLTFELRAGGAAPGFDGDMFDRLASALPYLNDENGNEFDIENPRTPWKRTPWVGTRHRLDALVGRTFDSRMMKPETLERIDDFFGPFSMGTLAQTIHFAKHSTVVDTAGHGPFGSHEQRLRLQHLPKLTLHSTRNGLADPMTKDLLASLPGVRTQLIFDRGHQDLLIGRDGGPIFQKIVDFLK